MHQLHNLKRIIVQCLSRNYQRLFHSATLGVRAIVIDANGQIFLVKHSYVDGWYLPGGGVETGESVIDGLSRELAEEGNIQLAGPPKLHGVFLNSHVSRRDHVVLYIVREFRQDELPRPNREIVAHGFFSPDSLPEDTSRGTRARIAEVLKGQAVSEIW